MPELLLDDEPQTTTKEEELPSLGAVYIDTSVMLQYYRYIDYFAQYGAHVYKFGREEEDFPEYIVGGEPIRARQWAPAWGRWWPYYGQVISIAVTASEPSDVESYEVKYTQPARATIATILSQTMEFLGYALPKQLGLSIEPPAFKLLENLMLASLTQKVLDMIALEKRQGIPIKSVSITSFKDPEAIEFEQLVVKVCLDCDSNTALGIWDELSRGIEDLKKGLSPHEIKVVDERLGLDCEW